MGLFMISQKIKHKTNNEKYYEKVMAVIVIYLLTISVASAVEIYN